MVAPAAANGIHPDQRWLQLLNPPDHQYYLDTAQAGGPLRALMLAACVFIAFALFQQLVDLVAIYTNLIVSWSASNSLRSDLALHCLRLDMSFHKRFTPGEIIERVDGDINQLGSFFAQLPIMVLGNSMLIIGILVMLFRVNPALGGGMLLYTLATLIVLSLIQNPTTSRWAAERQASAEQYGFIEEHISGAEDSEPSAQSHMLFGIC
jgi:ATP-binding cassette subfamily B protein